MGKTKTMYVEGVAEEKKSGKEAYEEKMKKKAAQAKAAEGDKTQVKGMGLKGGERIKIVGGEIPEEPQIPISEETETQTSAKKKQKVRSKNYKSAKSKIDKEKFYKLPEAIKLLKEVKYSKFDETIELHLVTRTQGVFANVTLPFSGGRQKKVEIADDATVEKLKSGKVDFDVLLATADMMPKLVPFARVLGPRGLMPNPKTGTLIKSKKDAEKFGGNTLTVKTEKTQPVIHTVVGKLSQKDEEIVDNAKTVLDSLPKQIVKGYIKSTMSPSIKLQVA